VAERRRKAERMAARTARKGQALSPVRIAGQAIARTFWGKAWCSNMERYSDFSNRLPRGRTYVRNGSVIDLQVAEGEVRAQVVGSSLYRTTVKVAALPKRRWQDISGECAGSIDSLVELLQGRFSKGVMERICRPQTGLFPSPAEIQFHCSCPDWASMCKHVAAVLYGIGARLDESPELLFTLRKVDAGDLVAHASADVPLAKQAPAAGRVLEDAALAEVFGIEIVQAGADREPAAPSAERAAAKPPEARRSSAAQLATKRRQPKTAARAKGTAKRKSAAGKPAKRRASSRRR
jgi:uncharacterized Zn finger protein